ncbi:C40 family peptidase [Mycobacterium lehmannii]|uniref:C40 family peptidase n=1 Tax=Mycobacterium lehmannii TaxID=2048550 RepID=UPI001E5010EE|nr:C40 family peptidase [Mycobacterium lehmannii]
MSVGAVVAQVGEVLGRAHALFGDPPASGQGPASGAVVKLSGAGQLVRSGQERMAPLSGQLATNYGTFAGGAGPALDSLAGNDRALSTQLDEAARSDRAGRSNSGGVVKGAAADTNGLAPLTNTPAGQKALLAALRNRVAQQQQVVQAYKARDAQLAAMLRSMAYGGRGAGGGGSAAPMSGLGGLSMPQSGGGGGFGLPLGGSGFGGLGSGKHGSGAIRGGPSPSIVTGRGIPPGRAGAAVKAALSKLGRPYVWGAEGPSSFDCSGLTEWAWRHGGVQLGDDTYAQVKQGVAVAPSEVRAGDLIFPKSSYDSRGPGHVMLAISATQVVHAPQTGDVVRIAPMPSGFVARRPVALD